jgi:hypothetical protein
MPKPYTASTAPIVDGPLPGMTAHGLSAPQNTAAAHYGITAHTLNATYAANQGK